MPDVRHDTTTVPSRYADGPFDPSDLDFGEASATPARAPERLYAASPAGKALAATDKLVAVAHGATMLADLVRRHLDEGDLHAAARPRAELHEAASRLVALLATSAVIGVSR